jgi:hypothetical protein
MSEIPLWPPILAVALGAIGFAVMSTWSRRLDREDEARRNRPRAE